MSILEEKNSYDIVVIGCGPAGAMAGKYAALHGAETLIIEQKMQVGLPLFDSMGVVYGKSETEKITGEKISPKAIIVRTKGVMYISPFGKEGKPLLTPEANFVNRHLFEQILATGALKAGAGIMLHSRVVDLITEGRTVKGVIIKNSKGLKKINCRLVIVADGTNRFFARYYGIEANHEEPILDVGGEFAAVKFLSNIADYNQVYMDGTGQNRYQHVSPYSRSSFVLGTGLWGKHNKLRSLMQCLDEFIDHLNNIKKYEFSRYSALSITTASMPVFVPHDTVRSDSFDGIMAAGSSSGYSNPGTLWSSGGMTGAAWSGRTAGTVGAEALKAGNISAIRLHRGYRKSLDGTLNDRQKKRFAEARTVRQKMGQLSAELQDRAVEEIGYDLAALHLFSQNAYAPLVSDGLDHVKDWLKFIPGL